MSARLQRENEAMVSLAQTLGAEHDQVSEAVYLAHEAHLAKVLPTVKDTHLHKAPHHSPSLAEQAQLQGSSSQRYPLGCLL
jgi:hypothetical protein